MILTKRQIVNDLLGQNMLPNKSKGYRKTIILLMYMPEEIFIHEVEKSLHWKLEPIRKNQYIVK